MHHMKKGSFPRGNIVGQYLKDYYVLLKLSSNIYIILSDTETVRTQRNFLVYIIEDS